MKKNGCDLEQQLFIMNCLSEVGTDAENLLKECFLNNKLLPKCKDGCNLNTLSLPVAPKKALMPNI